jgi:hypothetical protein
VIIIQALRSARSEYVVYFLLSAWLEVLDHNGRGRHLPAEVKLMPVRDARDVYTRLQVVRDRLVSGAAVAPENVRALQDAAAALAVACEKLCELRVAHARRLESCPTSRAYSLRTGGERCQQASARARHVDLG